MSPSTAPTAKLGLRERKKLKTREAIQREAMRLFQKYGYEETTIEQIAAGAEISPSTFFNYFPTKEDVVLYDAYDPMLASLMLERPADEPLSVGLRHVLHMMEDIFIRDHDVMLCGLVAQRAGRDADDFEIRVVVMVVVIAALEAMFEWVKHDGRGSFVELVNQALDVVDAGARLDAIASGEQRG
jgi:AcrR family transcriptional regulator